MPLAKDMLFNQLRNPETTQDMHVLNVYKDPEFLEDIKSSFPELVALVDIKSTYELPDGTIDPQTKMRMFYKIEKLDDRQFYQLSIKYVIHVNDTKIFLMGRHHTRKVFGARRSYSLTPNTGGDWTASIPVDITKEDFMKMWEDINRNKKLIHNKKVPKTKPPKHDELLYAIFKQRQLDSPTPFSKIHTMYLDDKLPYYHHDKADEDRIYDAKKFEEYYRKYQPKPIPPV
jgi:hypothetical protein